MITPTQWKDYELLDSGDGMKLERWGAVILARPDPQVLWPRAKDEKFWERAQAVYTRTTSGKGTWTLMQELPERWKISYGKLSFWTRPTDFKHTGLFPEQAVNWDWMTGKIQEARIKKQESPKILNLFAYTGGATLACLAAGAEVTHVDASEGIIAWAKENAELSGLADRPVRWIVDDVMKFVAREERRGQQYDAIIMDPPSYGRGKKNELWKIEEMLWPLMQKCALLLSNAPLFFTVNSYTTGMSSTVIENMLKALLADRSGSFSTGEVGLKPKGDGWTLPAGIFARWEAK